MRIVQGVNEPSHPPVPIGQRIDERLKELGRTASWLADLAKIERSTVSRILKGDRRHPTAGTLQSIAPVLGMTVAELVEGTDAADQVDEAPKFVSLEHYGQAVREFIEYQRKATDLAARLHDMTAELKQERERRRAAEDKLTSIERERDEARKKANHYADALELAIADITMLRTQVERLVAGAQESKWAGRIVAGLASIAAVASVATYLDRASERAKKSKAQKPKGGV